MYNALLLTHSWMRYPVLLLGIAVLAIALLNRRRPTPSLPRLHGAFIGFLDLQLSLGLLLYFGFSPITRAAMANMGAAMKDPALRFFGVEHITTMILALAAAHVGRARALKTVEVEKRHRTIIRAQLLWLVLTAAAIPWPSLDIGRPLFRM